MSRASRHVRVKGKKRKLKPIVKGKVPDGINPYTGLPEDIHDQLAKRDFSGPRKLKLAEKSADTWTTKECEEMRFSGIRRNDFTGMTEIWQVGRLTHSAPTAQIEAGGPGALAELLSRAFGVEVGVTIGQKVPNV